MEKLKVIIFLFIAYFAYVQYEEKNRFKTAFESEKSAFSEYKTDNNNIKQLEIKLTEIIKNAQVNTDNLRTDIDNNLIELRVKVESIEQYSTTASDTANRALRLAKSSQQDYFNLTNAISYNSAMINGWQEWYCQEVAPKNNTLFMCKQ